MKVAIIEPVGGHGGMDYYDYGLAMGLAKSGCEVTLHSSSNTVTRDFENVITKHTFGTIWQRSKLLKGALFFLGYIKSLFSSKTGKCDVVHLHFFNLEPRNFSALFLAKRIFRHNVVVTIHDVDSFKDSILTMDSAFGMMDQIIVHNEFSKKELLSKGVDESKIHVIPHGNYLPFIEECLHEPMVQRDKLNLLFFGQIKEVKGLDVLLNAMALVIKKTKNVHLTIAGRPWHDDASKYQKIIQEKNLKNYVTTRFEFIPDEDVTAYFSKADLVVLPYKRIYQSGVLLLAMSYGRPVLVSDLPAFSEIIIAGYNGLIFENKSVVDLAKKILSVYSNPEKLVKIVKRADDTLSKDYSWDIIAQKTINVYKR